MESEISNGMSQWQRATQDPLRGRNFRWQMRTPQAGIGTANIQTSGNSFILSTEGALRYPVFHHVGTDTRS